jgi:hypothetical protein
MRLSLCLLLLLGCAAKSSEDTLQPVSPSTSQPGASIAPFHPEKTLFDPEKKILFDARVPREEKKLGTEEQEKIISKLFPKRLKGDESCAPRNGPRKTSEEDIAAGQIFPSIITFVAGSFTAPGKKQVAYLVDVNECNAPVGRIDTFSTMMWVLTEGDAILNQSKTEYRAETAFAMDIDQNGTDEIVASRDSRSRDGIVTTSSVFMMKGDSLTIIDEFKTRLAMRNKCSYKEEPSLSLVLHYIQPTKPGQLPTFIEEELSLDCPKAEQ